MGKEEFWKVYWAEGTFSGGLDLDEINWTVHYYEYGIVKFHRGAKIHGLGRGLPSPFFLELIVLNWDVTITGEGL